MIYVPADGNMYNLSKYRHGVVTAVVVTCIAFGFWVRGYGIKVLMQNTSIVSFDGGSACKVDDVTA